MLKNISKKIKMVFTEDGFTYGNCLLVEDDVRLLIDSGAGQALAEARPEGVDFLINSHHHYDHIRGNDSCTQAKVLLHPLEQKLLQAPQNLTASAGWEELMGYNNYFDPRNIGIRLEQTNRSWRIDEEIHDGQIIDCGQTKLIVLHTPGHSPGHCCFYFPDEELVFLGDICLTKVGPWYGDPQTNIDDFLKSIDRIIELHPKKLVTGHINTIISDNPQSTLIEYRDRILMREQQILQHLQKVPCTIHQLAEQHIIYRKHHTSFVLFWEKAMLKNHLQRLLNLELIELVEDGRYRIRKAG